MVRPHDLFHAIKSLLPEPDSILVSLNAAVIGMVLYGIGYLMVASDGGIFNFSNLPFLGSLGGSPPAVPITSVAALL